MNITTTTREILNLDKPKSFGWRKLLNSLNKSVADDEPVSLEDVYKSNGIEDAVAILKCFDYKAYCLFLVDVTRLSLPVFETICPNDFKPRKGLQAIEDYYFKRISRTVFNSIICKLSLTTSSDTIYFAHKDDAPKAHIVAHNIVWYIVNIAKFLSSYENGKTSCSLYFFSVAGWSLVEKVFINHFCNNPKTTIVNNQTIQSEIEVEHKLQKLYGEKSGDLVTNWLDGPWSPEEN